MGTVVCVLAHADYTAAADMQAGIAHAAQGIETVPVFARVDDVAVELGRRVEVVVVVVEAGIGELLGLALFQQT
jgi:hypothetical protein